jgi:hypothetical protein
MALSRTTSAARPGLRALVCLADAVTAGVIVVAVLTLFTFLSVLLPGAGSPLEFLGNGCGFVGRALTCEPKDLESTPDIPAWYSALFVVVFLAAIAASSGALDAQRRTPGMRILSVYPIRAQRGTTTESAPAARWAMVVRWWIVVAVIVAGATVGQLFGGLIALALAWGFVLLPGRRTLWDRLTGVAVVELTFRREGVVPA